MPSLSPTPSPSSSCGVARQSVRDSRCAAAVGSVVLVPVAPSNTAATAMNNNKRKVDVNDNLEGFAFALPRVPPPALRSTNAFGRRQSIAGGTLPGRSGTSAPVFAVPAAPTAPAAPAGSSSSASRRHAEEQEQLDSVYNGYITTLSWKRKLEMSAASSRQDIDDQLSILLQDSARINEHKAKECGKLHALGLLQSSCDVACSLPFLLDESVMRESVPLDAVSECVNSRMNSLRCKEVKPIVDIQEFDNVAESLYEFGEIFCIPPEARKIAVNTAGCLHDVGESRIIAAEENKSLDKLKDTNYCLLAQNFSSTMKLS